MARSQDPPTGGPTATQLGAAIRSARLKQGLAQAALARRLDVSQGTISFWENGVETPTFRNLIKLALELPELTVVIEEHEINLLRRLRQLEQLLRGSQCGCVACACRTERVAG